MDGLKIALIDYVLCDSEAVRNQVIDYMRHQGAPDFIYDAISNNISFDTRVNIELNINGVEDEIEIDIDNSDVHDTIVENFLDELPNNINFEKIIEAVWKEVSHNELEEFVQSYNNIDELNEHVLKTIIRNFISITNLTKYSKNINLLLVKNANLEIGMIKNGQVLFISDDKDLNQQFITKFHEQIISHIKQDPDFLENVYNAVYEDLLKDDSIYFDEMAEFIIEYLTTKF